MGCVIEEQYKQLNNVLNSVSKDLKDRKAAIEIIRFKANNPVADAWAKSLTAGEDSVFTLRAMKVAESGESARVKTPKTATKSPAAKGSTKNLPKTDTPEFDKLPSYVEGQSNMTYAGIGSRETPAVILKEMEKVAEELSAGKYELRSGGAKGADKAFETGVNNDSTTNYNNMGIFYANQATDKTLAIAEELHPNWAALTAKGDYGAKLMARNTFQVFGANLDTPVDFVLFYAKETSNPMRPAGGTGQAVEMARRKGIPTINMADKDWRAQLDKVVDKDVATKPSITIMDKNWTRASAEADSANVYIFGDNTADKRSKYVPKATQAVVRALPNAFGIDTKKSRTEQFTEADYDKYVKYLDKVFKALEDMKAQGRTFVVSKDGIGTGKANLPAKLHNEMAKRFNAFVGQDLVPEKVVKDTSTKIYHGTASGRTQFESNYKNDSLNQAYGRGIYFTGNKAEAAKYSKGGSVIEVDIQSSDILDIDAVIPSEVRKSLKKTLKGIIQDSVLSELDDAQTTYRDLDFVEGKGPSQILDNKTSLVNILLDTTNTKVLKHKHRGNDNYLITDLGVLPKELVNQSPVPFVESIDGLIGDLNDKDSADILKELIEKNKKFAIRNMGNATTIRVLDDTGTGGSFLLTEFETNGNKQLANSVQIKKGSQNDNRVIAHELIHSLQYGMTVDGLTKDSKKYLNKEMKKFFNFEHGVITEAEYTNIWDMYKNNAKGLEAIPNEKLEYAYLTAVVRGDYVNKAAIETFPREFTAIIGSSPRFRNALYGSVPKAERAPFKTLIDDILKSIKRVKNLIRKILEMDPEHLRDNPDYESALKVLDEYLQMAPDTLKIEDVKKPVKRQKIEEIEETTPEVEETDGSLTKDQQEAANKINAMMKDPKQNIFVLEGEGGTGKSYTVGKVLADNPDASLIVGAATAHSAKDVISDFIEDALKVAGRDVPVERKVAIALPKQIEDSPTDTIIVLDEISMINNGTMNNILKGIEDKKGAVKIVLLGDRAQLRPIETKDEFKIFGRSIYVDGLKVEGSEVDGNFVTKDASYPIIYKGNDRYADNRNNKLKAKIFKEIDALGEGYHHTLTSQKRQKDIETYKAIRKFRTEVIEDTAEAENSPKYQKQLQDALTAVYSLPNVNAVSTPASMSDFMKSKGMVDQFKSGKAALVAPTNKTVNLANSLITKEFAAQDGQVDVHAKYGNFKGQTLRSTSNIKIGDIKVTNNTEVVVKDLSLLSEKAIDNIAVSAYPGTVLVDLAMSKAGVKSSDNPVIQVVLNAQGMPQAIRDSLTVAELAKGNNIFNSIVHNDVTDVKLANIRTSSDAVARDFGTVVMSVGDKKIAVKLSDIVVTDDRVGIIKEHKDELESFFNNFKPTYALTTHKSQGKSFESIVIDMKPVYFHSTVQKLESAYVGLTRSKGAVQVIKGEGDVHALVNALSLEGDVVEDTIYTQDSSVIPRSMGTTQEPAIITDNIVVDGVPDAAIAAEVARNINSAKKCD